MPRPFNRRQARENAAFIRLLGETGNVQLAARECGLAPPTLYARRKVQAAFAAEWDAAMTYAQARLRSDPAVAARAGRGRWPDSARAPARFTTAGGEPGIVRLKDGRLQLRLAKRGGIGFRAEQAFLRALATCGNIRMAARAIGVAPTNIDRRRLDPVFAGEMKKALRVASERLETALLERFDACYAGQGADEVWAERPLNPLPAMTTEQALMLLRQHDRRRALGEEWGRLATRKRRGPLSSQEIAIERQIWWAVEQEKRSQDARRRERAIARAAHYEATGNWFLPGEEVADVRLGEADGGAAGDRDRKATPE